MCLFFSLFFQADTPKTCASRENNLPCIFAAGSSLYLKPDVLFSKLAVAQKTSAPVIFLFGKERGRQSTRPDLGRNRCFLLMANGGKGRTPPKNDLATSLIHLRCPVTMPFSDIAGRSAQSRDTQGCDCSVMRL